jgi:hypothetical protein
MGPVGAPRAPMGSVGAPRMNPGFGPRAGPVGTVNRSVGVTTVAPSGRIFVHSSFPGHRFHNSNVFFRGCFGAFPCGNRFFFGDPFFFGSGFGFGTGFGFGFGAPYVPYYYPDTSYYPPYPPPNYNAAPPSDNSADIQLAMEIQKLSDEIEELRNEQSRERSANQPPASLAPQPPATATTFVFRDGHRISAINYAIAGQTLWIFSEHAAQKVALDDLDRAATEQVNAANGIYLYLPKPAPPR